MLPLLLVGCLVFAEGEDEDESVGGDSGADAHGSAHFNASSSGDATSSSGDNRSTSSSGANRSTSSSGAPSSTSSSTSSSSSGSAPITCALPWGGVLAHDASITAYENTIVAYGQTCRSQQRTCTNGALSGAYTAQTCTISEPVPVACEGEVVFAFPECEVPCSMPEAGKYRLVGSPTIILSYGGSLTMNGYCGGRSLRCATEVDGSYICTLGTQTIALPPP